GSISGNGTYGSAKQYVNAERQAITGGMGFIAKNGVDGTCASRSAPCWPEWPTSGRGIIGTAPRGLRAEPSHRVSGRLIFFINPGHPGDWRSCSSNGQIIIPLIE